MGGNTGKLQLLDDDDDPELHLPDIQKHSQHAYETAGLRSILDYFILRVFLLLVLHTPTAPCFIIECCIFVNTKLQ